MQLLQIPVHDCNQPEEEAKEEPRQEEAHGEYQQHEPPFHVQECGEDVLEILQTSRLNASRTDVTLSGLGDDPLPFLCERHISR